MALDLCSHEESWKHEYPSHCRREMCLWSDVVTQVWTEHALVDGLRMLQQADVPSHHLPPRNNCSSCSFLGPFRYWKIAPCLNLIYTWICALQYSIRSCSGQLTGGTFGQTVRGIMPHMIMVREPCPNADVPHPTLQRINCFKPEQTFPMCVPPSPALLLSDAPGRQLVQNQSFSPLQNIIPSTTSSWKQVLEGLTINVSVVDFKSFLKPQSLCDFGHHAILISS